MAFSTLKESSFCQTSKHGVVIHLKIHPRASKTGIDGITESYIKISIKSPPVDNEANIELIRFLSKFLGIPKSQVIIKSGLTGKNKCVEILNSDKINIETKLCAGLKR